MTLSSVISTTASLSKSNILNIQLKKRVFEIGKLKTSLPKHNAILMYNRKSTWLPRSEMLIRLEL